MSQLSEPSIETLVIPKVNSAEDLTAIANHIPAGRTSALNLVASIESAKALWSIGDIASWNHGVAKVSALLVGTVLCQLSDVCKLVELILPCWCLLVRR